MAACMRGLNEHLKNLRCGQVVKWKLSHKQVHCTDIIGDFCEENSNTYNKKFPCIWFHLRVHMHLNLCAQKCINASVSTLAHTIFCILQGAFTFSQLKHPFNLITYMQFLVPLKCGITHKHTHMHATMHTRTHKHAHTSTHTHACVCTHTHTQAHTHAHTRAHTTQSCVPCTCENANINTTTKIPDTVTPNSHSANAMKILSMMLITHTLKHHWFQFLAETTWVHGYTASDMRSWVHRARVLIWDFGADSNSKAPKS